jgi:hypothetical protein
LEYTMNPGILRKRTYKLLISYSENCTYNYLRNYVTDI